MDLSQLGYDCDNKEKEVLGQKNYRASLRNMLSSLSNSYRDWFRIGGCELSIHTSSQDICVLQTCLHQIIAQSVTTQIILGKSLI